MHKAQLIVYVKPNSITLSGSKLVRSWSQTDLKLIRDQLRTCLRPDSVMEFGFEPAAARFKQVQAGSTCRDSSNLLDAGRSQV